MHNRRSITRRSFVKGAALAVAAPTIISARALGGGGVAAPSERLTLGFIGIGKQGSGHVTNLSSRANIEVLAVSDIHTGRRARAKKQVTDIYAAAERKSSVDEYVHYMDLLNRKDISAVLIAVPDHWHTAVSMEACKLKKDIYCEKPLTLTLHEAKLLLDTVNKYNVVFQTGSQQRSTGPFRQACEYVRNGRIGKIKEIHIGLPGVTSKFCDLPAEQTPEGIEWDIWLGQAPQRDYNDVLCRQTDNPGQYPFNPGWRDYIEYSGGMITDWGAHHLDIVQWALDMDKAGPTAARPPEKADDLYNAQVIYGHTPVGDNIPVTHIGGTVWEGDHWEAPARGRGGRGAGRGAGQGRGAGATGAAAAPATQPASTQPTLRHTKETNGILFIGEKGRIFVNRSFIVSEPDTILKDPIRDSDIQLYKSPNNDHHLDWLECIKTRKTPVTGIEVGARSVAVCHIMNLTYWHRRALKWDPQKWEFPGDAEANAWRDRARRPKYDLPTA
ncbi:MAG TPA: Gfo/Idh/MocA family oxidoreductase [Humisphaera sp.]|jgi:predicted dehydrogenase|nr:Gfo/Idh/MocA family oxidoreductase [Humisphaera sp.]